MINGILFFSTIFLVLFGAAAAHRGLKYTDLAKRRPLDEQVRLELRANAWEIATVVLGTTALIVGVAWLTRVVHGWVA